MNINFVTCATLESLKDAEETGKIKDGTFIFCHESERVYIHMKNKLIGITPAKREIIELKCKSCGAPLPVDGSSSIVRCSYCKSVYDIDGFKMDVF